METLKPDERWKAGLAIAEILFVEAVAAYRQSDVVVFRFMADGDPDNQRPATLERYQARFHGELWREACRRFGSVRARELEALAEKVEMIARSCFCALVS